MLRTILAACGLVALTVVPVAAKPVVSTKYKYYSISGNSPGDIYLAMIRRGPDVNGVNANASTSATSSQSGKLVQGQSCKVDGYSFRIDFTINLPKLRNESALSGSTKRDWGTFKSFLKRHEETHRTIWLGCASQLEAQVKRLKAKDCNAIDKQAAKLWTKMRSTCDRQHKAFDTAEQRRLLSQPFVRLVLGKRGKSVAALKIAKKK